MTTLILEVFNLLFSRRINTNQATEDAYLGNTAADEDIARDGLISANRNLLNQTVNEQKKAEDNVDMGNDGGDTPTQNTAVSQKNGKHDDAEDVNKTLLNEAISTQGLIDTRNVARLLQRMIEQTEERLKKAELRLSQSVSKIENLAMVKSIEANEMQTPSIMNFGSYYIVADENGAIATNTMKIDVSKITEKPKMILTALYSNKCVNEKCQAFFSHIDICENDDQGYSWRCKFCHQKNLLHRIQLFSPNDNDICYVETHPAEETKAMEDYKIIFVIDISGSMEMPCQATLSRLDAVKKAVVNMLQDLINKTPERRMGLVIFNNVVKIYGTDEIGSVENHLDDMEFLLNEGKSNSEMCELEDNGIDLIQTMNGLLPKGSTALGPALVLALGMLENTRGSKIFVCTDGESNTGVGAMGQPNTMEFYQNVTDIAKNQAVSIFINSFDDCELSVLEVMARETGGNVRRISPTDLSIHMEEDLNRKLVATNTTLKLVVPENMYVKASGNNANNETVPVGNIADNNSHIMCFDFGCLPDFNISQDWQQAENGNVFIPFQMQVFYKDSEGKPLTRVYSMLRELTTNHDAAQMCMNAETIVTSLVQKAAKTLLNVNQHGRPLPPAQEFITQAKEFKLIDKIKSKPLLLDKLEMFILVLEKISIGGLNDEISTMLSRMATIA